MIIAGIWFSSQDKTCRLNVLFSKLEMLKMFPEKREREDDYPAVTIKRIGDRILMTPTVLKKKYKISRKSLLYTLVARTKGAASISVRYPIIRLVDGHILKRREIEFNFNETTKLLEFMLPKELLDNVETDSENKNRATVEELTNSIRTVNTLMGGFDEGVTLFIKDNRVCAERIIRRKLV